MKRPNIGEFVQTEGRPYAENLVTGEEVVLFEHKGSNIRFRSMFEEDVDNVAYLGKLRAKQRKQLLKKIQEKGSEEYCFIFEEMYQYENEEPKIIATAEMSGEDIDVAVFLKKGSNPKEFEFAKISILQRINAVVNALYEITGGNGKLIINRVTA